MVGRGKGQNAVLYPSQEDQYLALAGLYNTWTTPDGEGLYAVTIITTGADPFMAKVHHRMPVILA
jgi:putative SOS response-associated peptidase YedK